MQQISKLFLFLAFTSKNTLFLFFKIPPKNTYNFLLKIYYARAAALRNVFWRYFGVLKFRRKSLDFRKIQKNYAMFLKAKAETVWENKATHNKKSPDVGDFLFKLAFQFL
ncbi:MAG: hypothetical protein LiPW30_257 [Parcubacteria group bacterium LiPW_30]|nr:MAG: hypothetical protein LiPW30_257 [Parcubacteria group bacterium LiPW_30]